MVITPYCLDSISLAVAYLLCGGRLTRRLSGWDGLKALELRCTVRLDQRLPLSIEQLCDTERTRSPSVRAIVRAREELAALTLASEYLRVRTAEAATSIGTNEERCRTLSRLRYCLLRRQRHMQQDFIFRQDQMKALEKRINECK